MKIYILLSIIFCSCSNYRLTHRANPFKKYGIESVSVPMFYNHTVLNGISHHFTRYFTAELYDLKGLEVKGPNDDNVDAYFIGVIKGPKRLMETLQGRSLVEAKSVARPSISSRSVLIPAVTSVRLKVHLYLVRKGKSTKGIIGQLKENSSSSLIVNHDDVIFHESVSANASLTREIFSGENVVINQTQNKGILEKTIIKEAKNSANRFKNIILYAF